MSEELPLLSVLICSVDGRNERLMHLLLMINQQLISDPDLRTKVEIIVNRDDTTKSVGEKRNDLIAAARGRFVVFVDDDDYIHHRYLDIVTRAIGDDADLDFIGYQVRWCPNGFVSRMKTVHSTACGSEWSQDETEFRRGMSHINPVRRTIAASVMFKTCDYYEDRGWADMVMPLVTKEAYINTPMYFYMDFPKRSAARVAANMDVPDVGPELLLTIPAAVGGGEAIADPCFRFIGSVPDTVGTDGAVGSDSSDGKVLRLKQARQTGPDGVLLSVVVSFPHDADETTITAGRMLIYIIQDQINKLGGRSDRVEIVPLISDAKISDDKMLVLGYNISNGRYITTLDPLMRISDGFIHQTIQAINVCPTATAISVDLDDVSNPESPQYVRATARIPAKKFGFSVASPGDFTRTVVPVTTYCAVGKSTITTLSLGKIEDHIAETISLVTVNEVRIRARIVRISPSDVESAACPGPVPIIRLMPQHDGSFQTTTGTI